MISRVYNFLFTTETKIHKKRSLCWFSLSLIFAVIYSSIALHKAFSGEYVIQDDARQHVFWMSRFIDPELFPDDLIANYYQSIAPWGYKNLYRIMATFGVDPLVFSKILPGILCLIMTGYCFAVTVELLPIPVAGFVASLLFNQNIWMQDGLISGTAKAFIYPLFFAFLYYWLRRSLIGVCLTILLLSWFYPSFVLICGAVLFLQLWEIKDYKLRFSRDKNLYLFSGIGLMVAFVVLLPYVFAASKYGPTITLEQARSLPEFVAGGRASFFHDDDPWRFWFNASRSGIKLPSSLIPPLAYGGLLLPFLLRFSTKFSLSQKINPKISYLTNLLLVSFVLFFAAHALLFKLYLPSRYTQHTLKIVIIPAAGIALILILEAILNWAINNSKTKVDKSNYKSLISLSIIMLSTILLVGYPATLDNFINTGYIIGKHPKLYEFFQQQSKDIVIASLTKEADSISSFTQRSTLVSREHAIPYHIGYYQPFRQRAIDLIKAQYSTDLQIVKNLIESYGIDFWLIEKSSFTPQYLEQNHWIIHHQPVAQEAIENLKQGKTPTISLIKNTCAVFKDNQYIVINSQCIMNN